MSRDGSLGAYGTQLYSGRLIDLDENAEVRGPNWYGSPGRLGISSKMMRDAHVRRSVEAITSPIRTADWDVQPASTSEIDIEIAKFVEWNLFTRISFDDLLRDAMIYIRDGFSILEAVFEAGVSTPFSRLPSAIALASMEPRQGSSIDQWIASESKQSQLAEIVQRINGSDTEQGGEYRIPADRIVRFSWDQEGANFAGLAPLRSAYGPWKIKRLLQVLDAIRHERAGVGVPKITMPEVVNPDEKQEAENILESMSSHEKGYIVLPHGYMFEWTSGGSSTGMDSAIERCNRDIAFNLASGFNLLGLQNNAPGSHALATTQQGQLDLLLEMHANFIADRLNRGSDGFSVIRFLVDVNYGSQHQLPRLVPRNLPTRNWAGVLPMVMSAIDKGLIRVDDKLEEFTRRVLKLPAYDPQSAREVSHDQSIPPSTDASKLSGGDDPVADGD
jgi:hypothetical protein